MASRGIHGGRGLRGRRGLHGGRGLFGLSHFGRDGDGWEGRSSVLDGMARWRRGRGWEQSDGVLAAGWRRDSATAGRDGASRELGKNIEI